jgi:two-component system, LytTR family, response regulator
VSVRVLIVDDEAAARRRIRRLLASEPDVVIAGECEDGASALKAVERDPPDIVFLDVQMPELDGFELVDAFSTIGRERLPAIVFVTAFDRYALRAFDVHAIDYLLKPFTPERFRTALVRARGRLAAGGRDSAMSAFIDELRVRRSPARVAVKVADRLVVIDWSDVDWIEAADNYVTLHVGSKDYLLRETLTALEKRLDPARFARVHRSAIVQIDRIVELRPTTHGDAAIRLRNGTSLTLSRTWRERITLLRSPAG